MEPDKKTKDEESVDDKEKDSTPDPSPDNKNKTKPIAGELYRVAMWRSHVQFTQAATIIISVYCGDSKKDYQSRSKESNCFSDLLVVQQSLSNHFCSWSTF